MVLAAKGNELWSRGWKCFPEMMLLFEQMKKAIDTAEELRVLDAIYEAMPRWNFSSHLLQCAPNRLAIMEMKDVLWSDWRNSERILSGLEKIGKRPAVRRIHSLSFTWDDGLFGQIAFHPPSAH